MNVEKQPIVSYRLGKVGHKSLIWYLLRRLSWVGV